MPALLDAAPAIDADDNQWPPLSWSLPIAPSSSADPRPVPERPAGPDDPILLHVCWTRFAGRSLLALGGLLVAFAAFQVWGTSLIEWRAQRQLATELMARLPPPAPPAPTVVADQAGEDRRSPTMAPVDGAAPEPPAAVTGSAANAGPVRLPLAPMPDLAEGDVVGRIEIPAIGLSKVILEGVSRDTLRQGPGMYPSTALPGHPGTTAIAGHRTTHGAPFFELDRLAPGDQILVETPEGRFEYVVEGHDGPDGTPVGHQIVHPDAVEVLSDNGRNRLTLTACHPRYSAEQRIVVTALLVGPPLTPLTPLTPPPLTVSAEAADTATAPDSGPAGGSVHAGRAGGSLAEPPAGGTIAVEAVIGGGTGDPVGVDRTIPSRSGLTPTGGGIDTSLHWQKHELEPTLTWATVTVLVAHAAWVLGRLWRPRAAWLVAVPALAPCLFTCFLHLDRLLPAL